MTGLFIGMAHSNFYQRLSDKIVPSDEPGSRGMKGYIKKIFRTQVYHFDLKTHREHPLS